MRAHTAAQLRNNFENKRALRPNYLPQTVAHHQCLTPVCARTTMKAGAFRALPMRARSDETAERFAA
jgi:hypothetical protein